MSWFHIHRYRLVEDWTYYDWGGIPTYKKLVRCRCGTSKAWVRAKIDQDENED